MRSQTLAHILALSAALVLMGCGQRTEEPRADNADIAIDENQTGAEAKLNQIGVELDRAANRAEHEAKQAADKTKQAAREGAEKVERAAQTARDDVQKDKK